MSLPQKEEISSSEENKNNEAKVSEQTPHQSLWSNFSPTSSLSLLSKCLCLYFLYSFIFPSNTNVPTFLPRELKNYTNLIKFGHIFEFAVYMSESPNYDDYDNYDNLVVKDGYFYTFWERFNSNMTFKPSVKFVNNQSDLFLYAFVWPNRLPMYTNGILNDYVSSAKIKLNKHMKVAKKRKNLLWPDSSNNLEDELEGQIWSHWHVDVTLNLVIENRNYTIVDLPPGYHKNILTDSNNYKPLLFFNTYWNFDYDYKPVLKNTEQMTVNVTFRPASYLNLQIFYSLNRPTKDTELTADPLVPFVDFVTVGEHTLTKPDSYRYFLKGHSLNFLILFITLHILHMMSASASDHGYKEPLETKLYYTFNGLIWWLYLLNSQVDYLITLISFADFAKEAFELSSHLGIGFGGERQFLGFLPFYFYDRQEKVQCTMKKYRDLAYKKLSWLFITAIFYMVYSLILCEHFSWYNWFLSVVCVFLMVNNFIRRCSRLFKNYLLKSTVYKSWRESVHSFLCPVLNDTKSFIFYTPDLLKVDCFADDIVYIVEICQKYFYRNVTRQENIELGEKDKEKKSE